MTTRCHELSMTWPRNTGTGARFIGLSETVQAALRLGNLGFVFQYEACVLMVMDTAILLLIGFGGGFYFKAKRARLDADKAELKIARLSQELAGMRETDRRRREESERRKQYYEENDISDARNQIRFIGQVDLYAVRPVNKEAVRVLYALEEWIRVNQPRWRISFEVGMGAFIRTSNSSDERIQKAAFSSCNSKRVDFLLIDPLGQPVLAVEYHGSGHNLSSDAGDRMRVKRLVLERVGIPLVEVPVNAGKADVLHMIDAVFAARSLVGQSVTSPDM